MYLVFDQIRSDSVSLQWRSRNRNYIVIQVLDRGQIIVVYNFAMNTNFFYSSDNFQVGNYDQILILFSRIMRFHQERINCRMVNVTKLDKTSCSICMYCRQRLSGVAENWSWNSKWKSDCRIMFEIQTSDYLDWLANGVNHSHPDFGGPGCYTFRSSRQWVIQNNIYRLSQNEVANLILWPKWPKLA